MGGYRAATVGWRGANVRRRQKSPTCQVAAALQPTYRDAGECGNFASYQYSCMSTGGEAKGNQRKHRGPPSGLRDSSTHKGIVQIRLWLYVLYLFLMYGTI